MDDVNKLKIQGRMVYGFGDDHSFNRGFLYQ